MFDLLAHKRHVGGPNFVDDVAWVSMVRKLIFKVFFKYPDRDFLVTPYSLYETGEIIEHLTMPSEFDCPVLPTPIKRNLFRLYATILFLARNAHLGTPKSNLSKLRAMEMGHVHILSQLVPNKPQIQEALASVYSVLFTDMFVIPLSSLEKRASVSI